MDIKMNNYAIVEGLVSEVDSKDISWTAADGSKKEGKAGTIRVRVDNEDNIDSDGSYQIVPVSFFINKHRKDGQIMKPFISMESFLSTVKSIASDGITEATKVRITGGNFTMREFEGRDGNLVSNPEIDATFFNVAGDNFRPRIEGNLEMAVVNMEQEVDADGVETGTLIVYGATTDGYSADLIQLKAHDPRIVTGLQQVIEVGSVYNFYIQGDFATTVETVKEEVLIGDPVERTRTTQKRDLLITGVSEADLDVTEEDIKAILDKRTARLEKQKAKAQARASQTKQPVIEKQATAADFGF